MRGRRARRRFESRDLSRVRIKSGRLCRTRPARQQSRKQDHGNATADHMTFPNELSTRRTQQGRIPLRACQPYRVVFILKRCTTSALAFATISYARVSFPAVTRRSTTGKTERSTLQSINTSPALRNATRASRCSSVERPWRRGGAGSLGLVQSSKSLAKSAGTQRPNSRERLRGSIHYRRAYSRVIVAGRTSESTSLVPARTCGASVKN